ncbi:helix-turn-helix transcriptional regulator [Providencia rettgeri]|uniref:helix-turn-helix transcriptional regulator n=1 Tax=Providencia rettgeri TaxID=587 RepID=UPI00300FC2CC
MIVSSTKGGVMEHRKLIKANEVLRRCAISRATLYRLISKKCFPNQVSVTGSRSVAWREDEIQKWINDRPYSK